MRKQKSLEIVQTTNFQKVHIQTLISNDLVEINTTLNSNYQFEQGFNSSFIGYGQGTINFDELAKLFKLLNQKLGDKILLWGAEQTVHGVITLLQRGKSFAD